MHVRFPPSCSSSVELPFARINDPWLSLEAFPRRFPTTLSHQAFPRGFFTVMSHMPPWCQSILGLKVEAVPGKQASLEWTETSGGLWEWWHGGTPCGKTSWESLMGNPRGKATDPLIQAKGSVTLLLKLGRKAHLHAHTRDED